MYKKYFCILFLALGITSNSNAQFLKRLNKALDKFLETTTTETTEKKTSSSANKQQSNKYINGIYQANLYDDVAEMPRPHITSKTKVFTVDDNPVFSINKIYFSDGAAFVKTPDKKYLFVDTLGNVLFNFAYGINTIDPYPYFEDGVCPVHLKTGKTGLINKKGELVKTLPAFRITNFVDGIATGFVSVREGYTKHIYSVYFDTKGNQVFKNLTEQADIAYIQPPRGFSEGLAAFYSYTYRRYGFIDTKGNMVIAPQFSEVQDFSEGLAAVKTPEGKWGFINKAGKMVIPAIYSTEPSYFHEGLAVIRKRDRSYCYIDTIGKIVFQGLSDAMPFYNGQAFIRKNDNQIMIINKQGKYISAIKSHLSEVDLKKLISYSSDGKEILISSCFITPMGDMLLGADHIYRPFSDGLTFCVDYPNGAQRPANVGCINKKGEFVFVFKESEF